MATDPVRNIQPRVFETALDVHVADPLKRLASAQPSVDAPYLTVTLDWTPTFGNPGRRPAEEIRVSERRNRPEEQPSSQRASRTWFEQQGKQLLAELDPRSEQHVHLSANIDRMVRYLDEELDPSASGVYMVSCSALDIFEPLALGIAVDNTCERGPLPVVDTLAHIAEDYATYGILVCNQEEAELSFVTQGIRDRGVYLESTLFPRRQRQGSLSERNFRERADQRIFHFARAISDELTKELRDDDAEVLVLVGSDLFMRSLMREFPDEIKSKVADTVRMDLSRTPSTVELLELTAPIAMRAERDREAVAVGKVRDHLGSGRAVAGTIDVLNAMQAHQVELLVMNEDFVAAGWADLTLPLYGIGPVPTTHPINGDVASLIAVDLGEELVRLALHTGGEIEFVHERVPIDAGDEDTSAGAEGQIPRSEPAKSMDEIGGIGAILRFAN